MTKIVNSILLVAIGVLVLYGSWNLTIWMYRAILGVPALERRIDQLESRTAEIERILPTFKHAPGEGP